MTVAAQTITLPWPDSRLRPNARPHWANKAKITKSARTAAFYLARAIGASAPDDGPIALIITFHQPDRRHRDMDGCISQIKPYLDGLADAMKVNDRRFVLTLGWGETLKPGRVEVAIGGAK